MGKSTPSYSGVVPLYICHKQQLTDLPMNRREAIKLLASLGAVALLPRGILQAPVSSREFHFVGLGGGGCNALENIHKKGVRAKYTCVTNPLRPHLPPDVEFVRFVPPACFDRNYMDSISKQSFDAAALPGPEIQHIFRDDSTYVLLAALGGYTGSKLVRELAEYLVLKNKRFIIICSAPFSFEGKVNIALAERIKEQLRPLPDFHCFDLQSLREIHGNMTLSDAFAKADEQFYDIFMANSGQLSICA
jgi:hypothetical protein